jgi:hypothetical protein
MVCSEEANGKVQDLKSKAAIRDEEHKREVAAASESGDLEELMV